MKKMIKSDKKIGEVKVHYRPYAYNNGKFYYGVKSAELTFEDGCRRYVSSTFSLYLEVKIMNAIKEFYAKKMKKIADTVRDINFCAKRMKNPIMRQFFDNRCKELRHFDFSGATII